MSAGEAVRPRHLAALQAYHTKTTLERDYRLDGTLMSLRARAV